MEEVCGRTKKSSEAGQENNSKIMDEIEGNFFGMEEDKKLKKSIK